MNMSNLTQHKCKGKCTDYKDEQCSHCCLGLSDYHLAFPVDKVHIDKVRHFTDEEIQASNRFLATIQSMGDDTHIENHVSPLCVVDFSKNDSQSDLSIKDDALNRMESLYIKKKKQCELMQTEVARLNQKCERQAAEMVVMQVQIDSLTANW